MLLPALDAKLEAALLTLQTHCLGAASAVHFVALPAPPTMMCANWNKAYVIRGKFQSLSFVASMATGTGDIKNNLMKLLREIQRMRLQIEPNIQG